MKAPAWWKRLVNARARQAELDALALETARLVVVDVETTGLDTERDDLLSIGAVVIDGLRIDLRQQFERTLRRPGNQPLGNVLIHGIPPSQLSAGHAPERVLEEFLDFVGDSPLFAFHAPFDRRVLQRAIARHLAQGFNPPFADVAELAPVVYPERAPKQNTLDPWLAAFDLQVGERHNAAADAMATAELLLILLHRARAEGTETVGALMKRATLGRRLQMMRELH